VCAGFAAGVDAFGISRQRNRFRPTDECSAASLNYIWCHRWYHTPVEMEKTTIYLPRDLKTAVKNAARRRGVSEADVIRESIRANVGETKPRPRGGLFSHSEAIAQHCDELLEGFGQK